MKMSDPVPMFLVGVVMIVVPVVLITLLIRWCFRLDREQFERTNSYGMKEYATYEDMRRDVNRETGARVMGFLLFVPGLISMAFGILCIIVAIDR